jgi:type IV secretion system protein VirB5
MFSIIKSDKDHDDDQIDSGYVEIDTDDREEQEPPKGTKLSKAVVAKRPIQHPEIQKAGERYIEQYGDPLVTNTYLKVAVLLLSVVVLGEAAVMSKEVKALADIRPLIIRIDDVGHADAIDYKNYAYKPQEAENKYYLTHWTQLHFGCNRFTIENDQTDGLFFEDSATSAADITAEQKTKFISAYQKDTSLPYVEVQVTNIILGDLNKAPYSAQIEFLKIFKDPNSGAELKRERWTASVNYVFRDSVPNNMIAINPLGLTIIHYRIDQAFSTQPAAAPTPQTGGRQ